MRLAAIITIMLMVGFAVKWIGSSAVARGEAERLLVANQITKDSLQFVIEQNRELQQNQSERENVLQNKIQEIHVDDSCLKCVLSWE